MRRRYEGVESAGLRYLDDAEIKNPLMVMEEFFEAYDIEVFRQDLRKLFMLSCSGAAYRNNKRLDPCEMISTHRQVTRFIEFAYLIHDGKDLDFKIDKEHPIYQHKDKWNTDDVDIETRSSNQVMKHWRVLANEEVNDVSQVFKNIFLFMSLGKWQDELDMLLYYSLNDTAIGEECENSDLYFPMYELLEKLLEATDVIRTHEFDDYSNDFLPEGTTVSNPDESYFPVRHMMALYHYSESGAVNIEEEEADVLPGEFRDNLIRHFKNYPAKEMSANLRKIYRNYLNGLLEQKKDVESLDLSFVFQMDQFFKVLDSAEGLQ